LKVEVYDTEGKSAGKVDVPGVFETRARPDLIRRVFWLVGSHSIQPKGRDPMAGERTTAETHNPPTGTGRSRIPRVKGEMYSRSGLAGGVASVVKGRLPHPPRSEKVVRLEVNKKERKLATESAIAYTANRDAVVARGHKVNQTTLPFVVSDDVETLDKAAALVSFLGKVNLEAEVARVAKGTKRNTGKRRLRGRVYRRRTGPLFVITNDRGLRRAAGGIPGLDVVKVGDLSILDLAPGGEPGRLTLWTESAMTALALAGHGVAA
jgi:large subunit ribosomal protein L4e